MKINSKVFLQQFGLSLLLILICLPRFNRNSFIIDRGLNDAAFYIAYVEFFRGETPSAILAPASNWRPLIPFLSSFLPFTPMTSINIINIICLLIALHIFYKILLFIKIQFKNIFIGCLLFILSFPVFYYSTIGYVDPGGVLFCTLGCYFILRKWWNSVFFVIIIGLLAKETIFIVIPAAIIYLLITTNRKKTLFYSLVYFFSYLTTTFLIHKLAPITEGIINPTFWYFSYSAFMSNLLRPNAYLSLLFSLGLPGLILLLYTFQKHVNLIKKKPYILSFIAAIITGLCMYFFAFLTAAADGRIIWMIYPFLIPYAILLIDNYTMPVLKLGKDAKN